VYYGGENLVELARLLNVGEQKTLTKTEQAASDATLLANAKKEGNDLLLKQALMSAANTPFIEEFISLTIPDVAGYKTDNGSYTTELEDRIENALFMYVFNNDSRANKLLEAYRETGESNVKFMLNGIMDNLKHIARLRNLIEKHGLLDLDITKDLIDSLSEVSRLRAEGIKLEEVAFEQDLFSNNQEYISDDKLALYQAVAGINSNNKAKLFIAGYYASAYDAINPDQSTIFSNAVESKEQFLDTYAKEWMVNYGQRSKDKNPPVQVQKNVGKAGTRTKETPTTPQAPTPEAKITAKTFSEQYRKAQEGKLTPEQIDLQLKTWDALFGVWAKEKGITLDEAYADWVSNITDQMPSAEGLYQDLLAYVSEKDGKYTIGFISPNFSSGLHEQAHIGRSMMAKLAETNPAWKARLDAAEAFSGVKDGVWTKDAEEKFAKGYEKFLFDGVASSPKMKTVFAKIKAWMQEIVGKLKSLSGITLDANIIAVYDAMLGVEQTKAEQVKSRVVADTSSDPVKLESALDKLSEQRKNFTVKARKTGALIDYKLIDIDTNATLVEVKHQGKEYEVNGFHAANNDEAIAKVTELLDSNTSDGTLTKTLYQAVEHAEPEKKRVLKSALQRGREAMAKDRITARAIRLKMDKTNIADNWEAQMKAGTVTMIRHHFPSAVPLNEMKLMELKAMLDDLVTSGDEGAAKKINSKIRRMIKMDANFKDALESITGYRDLASIPFDQTFSALHNLNPIVYKEIISDEYVTLFTKMIPAIKEQFGSEHADRMMRAFIDITLSGRDSEYTVSQMLRGFMQPQRLLPRYFGKAGARLVDKAYHGSIQLSMYEHEYHPYLEQMHTLLLTPKNNRGAAYFGEEITIIGKTIIDVMADKDVDVANQPKEIKSRIEAWNKANDGLINLNDVEEFYATQTELAQLFEGFITAWNADPAHEKAQIGIRENYVPWVYDIGNITTLVNQTKGFLYRPGSAKQRKADEPSTRKKMRTNLFNVWRSYTYAMSKYMAYYDLAEYATVRILTLPTGRRKNLGSQLNLDASKSIKVASRQGIDYAERYVKDVIGYHKASGGLDRFFSAAKSNAYTSVLTANLMMTVLNFNQRFLMGSTVDAKVAESVVRDVKYWSGDMRIDESKYPKLVNIMKPFVIHNKSLIADLAAKGKEQIQQGNTKAANIYYAASAEYAKWLGNSAFQYAEHGNRAWGHAAGVYQVVMDSAEYKNAIKSGKSRKDAMEIALGNKAIYRASVTYGGLVNAEINADASAVFAPEVFRESSGIKQLNTFVRYSVTLGALELRTIGGFKSMENPLNPDIARMLYSGNANAITDAQIIQTAQIMLAWTSEKRIERMLADSDIHEKEGHGKITADQVRIFNKIIASALDSHIAAAKSDYSTIIKGKSGAAGRLSRLLMFSTAEVILRLLAEILFSLIPWWKGSKQITETDIAVNLIGMSQALRSAQSYRLGAGVVPQLSPYTSTTKQANKAVSQGVLRVTPFLGTLNMAGRVFTGKYFSDQFWDKVYE